MPLGIKRKKSKIASIVLRPAPPNPILSLMKEMIFIGMLTATLSLPARALMAPPKIQRAAQDAAEKRKAAAGSSSPVAGGKTQAAPVLAGKAGTRKPAKASRRRAHAKRRRKTKTPKRAPVSAGAAAAKP